MYQILTGFMLCWGISDVWFAMARAEVRWAPAEGSPKQRAVVCTYLYYNLNEHHEVVSESR